jgi:hypothetical protein
MDKEKLRKHFEANADIRLLALAPDEIESMLNYFTELFSFFDDYLTANNYDVWWLDEAINNFLTK